MDDEGRSGSRQVQRPNRVPSCAEGFTVRRETAGDITAPLAAGASLALVPAAGSGGWPCGKTQLAVAAARGLHRTGAVDTVAWVTADSRASVLSGYTDAAIRLGLGDGGAAGPAADRLLHWLATMKQPWLLVLDGVRDAADLEDLWPSGQAGRVLITAPDPAAIPVGHDVLIREVPWFSPREALTYVTGRLTADPDQRGGALDLVTELGGEPAALAQATAVIADADLTCREYQQFFTQQRKQLGIAVPASAVTWRLSAEHAQLIEPDGGTWPMLVLISLLDGHGIPATVLTSPAVCQYLSADPRRAWTVVLALERAGLVTLDNFGDSADPPVVLVSTGQQAAVRRAAQPDLLRRAIGIAADAVAGAWPEKRSGSLLEQRFRSCAARLLDAAGDLLWTKEGCHRVLWLAGDSLDQARMPGSAAGWWRRLTNDTERVCGPVNPETLAARGQLTAALLAAGQGTEAVSQAERVLDGCLRVFGSDHVATVEAWAVLGQALVAVGKPGDASAVLAEAVAASERVYHPGEPVALALREEHAAACLAAGLTSEAISEYLQVLESVRRAYGPGHPAAVATGIRLGDAYLAAGQPGDAIAVQQELLTHLGHGAGPEHPDTLAVSAALARAYSADGRISESLRLLEETCATCQRALGADHPETLALRADLARAYWGVGQAADALAVLADTIDRSEKTMPPGDPRIRALHETLTEMTGG